MSAVSRPLLGPWLATAQTARYLLVGTTCATAALAPSRATFAGTEQAGPASLWWILAAAVVVVHLYHAFGTVGAYREPGSVGAPRPRGWPVTFALLSGLVYLPMIWSPAAWGISQVFFVASAALLFRGLLRVLLCAAPIAVTAVGTLFAAAGIASRHPVADAIEVVVVFTAIAGCLVGVALLVRAVAQLERTRTDLAEQAAGRERLRVSRDLHDLLGQSLSAVSLKGDLAAALLPSDPSAARSEIHGIAALARETLQAMRRVTLGEHTISLRAEAAGATALLSAAGIDTHHHIDLPALAPEVDDAFAWATREGITNVLRHSAARTCWIEAGRRDGTLFLEIVNDGAHRKPGSGNGLSGLAERTAALSGTVSARHSKDGLFHLRVEIPGGTL
ncbi:sensor histidine kinase [Nocardia sp. NPDC127606]|uniref:sensor histidine kinase n=1 Tax=Nocardia sp. NPDC127606 TaxID=3345406 RepID=UPI0036355739